MWLGLEEASFAKIPYCIYVEILGGWVRKSPKLYWRNIWMVPNTNWHYSKYFFPMLLPFKVAWKQSMYFVFKKAANLINNCNYNSEDVCQSNQGKIYRWKKICIFVFNAVCTIKTKYCLNHIQPRYQQLLS